MKSFKRLSKALAAGLLLLVSALSHSAPVTIMGDDLIFTYDDSTLFGTANVIGNSIFFLPTNFIAQAANDDGAVQVTDTVDIEIQVKEGSSYLMDNFQLFESGDYLLNGSSASAVAPVTEGYTGEWLWLATRFLCHWQTQSGHSV